MFEKFKTTRAIDRLIEERLFEMALDEMEQGDIRRGIYAKAIAHSDGSNNSIKSHYVRLRVEAMKDEAQVIKTVKRELERSDNPANNLTQTNLTINNSKDSQLELEDYLPIFLYELATNANEQTIISRIRSKFLDGKQGKTGQWHVHQKHFPTKYQTSNYLNKIINSGTSTVIPRK